ncbi:MAG: tRNA (adenosine(37)-N6)-threonylcarbamoyltransferase complex transferase subunit TsaD [Cyclobacteriaceae bacterium]|nr:tRNA (adenosine(37)-N6)-threonylcarbamoyltransferase complex transferase subunit TsaD [Cyclobacteriaceae bacterium]
MQRIILGIESSCDETSASICREGKIVNNIIATQSIHEEYGGVVPELASREHQKNIVPIIDKALKHANIDKTQLSAIACTQGPGLLGSLLVGYSFAKSLAFGLGIPLLNVHHMKAHILAHFIDDPAPDFPFLCLTVSGGHTQIVRVNSVTDMQVIGQTRDDAVGEAFDKGAKLMGLPYPGGPLIDKYARDGDPERFSFSESDVPGLDFSFSGIKTSLLYFLQKETKKEAGFIDKHLHDICASYQKTLINMLVKKLVQASLQTNIRQVAIAGGVAANQGLRLRLMQLKETHGWELYIPDFQYCTDNAGMIAMAGWHYYLAGNVAQMNDSPLPRMPF